MIKEDRIDMLIEQYHSYNRHIFYLYEKGQLTLIECEHKMTSKLKMIWNTIKEIENGLW